MGGEVLTTLQTMMARNQPSSSLTLEKFILKSGIHRHKTYRNHVPLLILCWFFFQVETKHTSCKQVHNTISFPARISGLEVMASLMPQDDLEPGALWTIPQGANKCISNAAASAFYNDGHDKVQDPALKKNGNYTLASLPPSKL